MADNIAVALSAEMDAIATPPALAAAATGPRASGELIGDFDPQAFDNSFQFIVTAGDPLFVVAPAQVTFAAIPDER